MQLNSKIPLIIAFMSALSLTYYGTTLTPKDYNNFIPSEHKFLGVEVIPIVAFSCWNASFVVRDAEFYGFADEAANRMIGLVFFMFLMAASSIPSIYGYKLALMAYNKINS